MCSDIIVPKKVLKNCSCFLLLLSLECFFEINDDDCSMENNNASIEWALQVSLLFLMVSLDFVSRVSSADTHERSDI